MVYHRSFRIRKIDLPRSMNLLEKPTKGVISFEGVDITDKNNWHFQNAWEDGNGFPTVQPLPLIWQLKENITLSPIKNKGVSKADAETRPWNFRKRLAWKIRQMPTQQVYQVVSNNVLRLHVVWLWIQTFSCLTNQHQHLTQKWLVKFYPLCRTC